MNDFESGNVLISDGTIGLRPERRSAVIRPGLPPDWETFTQRVSRMTLHERLGKIGAGQWNPIIDRHRLLTDQQVLEAVARLERGQRAFDDGHPQAAFTRRADWDGFVAAMRSLRDRSIPCQDRQALIRMGEKIEARQRPNAERMGWA
jgi:hypothetical protein